MTDGFAAGAAAVRIDPPPGLPMVGSCGDTSGRAASGAPLEVTAVLLEANDVHAVVAGVDTLGIQAPEVDALRERVAAPAGASREAVFLNWNHTHCAPPGGRSIVNLGGDRQTSSTTTASPMSTGFTTASSRSTSP